MVEISYDEDAIIKDEASTLSGNDREDLSPRRSLIINDVEDSNENDNERENNNDTNQTEEGENKNSSTSRDDSANPESESSPELSPLIRSNRLKQYLQLVVLSSLAFTSAYESDSDHNLTSYTKEIEAFRVNEAIEVLAASTRGRNYALVLSGVSLFYHFIIINIHLLDSVCNIPRARKLFQDGSDFECVLIVLSAVWWLVGTWVLTSVHGVAGDGRGQFNLYFSTWLCLIANLNMIEIWLISAGYASVLQAVRSWPNLAPGWIMIFTVTLACMLSILDLFLRYDDVEIMTTRLRSKYEGISLAQWIWLISACAMSLVTAFGFSLVELFRREDYHVRNIKSSFEFSLEGICLTCLVFVWVPIVVVATTSDGACSEVGNSYFLTWASALVVIQTFILWLQSWRGGVHDVILKQDREYREAVERAQPMRSSMYDDDDDDEIGE